MGSLSAAGVVTVMTVPSVHMTGDNDPTADSHALTLHTDDGVDLEAQWTPPSGGERPVAVVVLAHPHPAHGGNMTSLVTSELFRALPARGCGALRFNFRGVGASTGKHGGGEPERLDVAAAVAAAADLAIIAGGTGNTGDTGDTGDVALVVAGWSFGADVSLAVVDPAITGWFAVAPPLRILTTGQLLAAHDQRPKHLAVPENDEFNPPERCAPKVADWHHTTVEVIAGADHYLVGRTARLTDSLVGFAESLSWRNQA
jgi:uncharacterized protein